MTITPTQRLRELEQQEDKAWRDYMSLACGPEQIRNIARTEWRKTMDEIVELKQRMGELCEPS